MTTAEGTIEKGRVAAAAGDRLTTWIGGARGLLVLNPTGNIGFSVACGVFFTEPAR